MNLHFSDVFFEHSGGAFNLNEVSDWVNVLTESWPARAKDRRYEIHLKNGCSHILKEVEFVEFKRRTVAFWGVAPQ